jgi:hypothetical protein
MKLFKITNGYIGDGYVHVLCIAESEAKALEMAKEKLKVKAESTYLYPPGYYKKLAIELLCSDVTNEFCSEIYD